MLIADKAKGTSANPQVTLYQNASIDDDTSYTPRAGWRYGYSVDVEDAVRKYLTTGQSNWLGIDFLAPDPAPSYWNSIERLSGPSLADEGAYYTLDVANANDAYIYSRNTVEDGKETFTENWTTSTWYGKKTYYTKFTQEEFTTTTHTHSVKADRNIGINFFGYEQSVIDVNSTAEGADIIIAGPVLNTSGTTQIHTNGYDVGILCLNAGVSGEVGKLESWADNSVEQILEMQKSDANAQFFKFIKIYSI